MNYRIPGYTCERRNQLHDYPRYVVTDSDRTHVFGSGATAVAAWKNARERLEEEYTGVTYSRT